MATKVIKPVASKVAGRRITITPTELEKRPTLILPVDNNNRKPSQNVDKPSPLDFDAFIPWVCLEWCASETISVKRICKETIVRSERRSSSAKSKSSKSIKIKQEDVESIAKKDPESDTKKEYPETSIPILAYYNSKGHLTEIAIVNSPFSINRKLIKAIYICLPFHSSLTRLCITKGGLTSSVLYDIAKILPHSNITEVYLDDTNVPEGNYYVLLDYASQLKVLSLNNCKINDIVCKEIAARMDFNTPGSLLLLSLSSNIITDTGAWFLGEMLRKNRSLLYLNLAGNRITDKGLTFVMKSLMEFPLTYDEILEKKRRKLQYLKKKMEVYNWCLQDISQKGRSNIAVQKTARQISPSKQKQSNTRKSHDVSHEVLPSHVLANNLTNEIVGDFNDVFDDINTIKKNNYVYCKGNLTLCSLNLAYNNLDFCSVKRILEVLQYQNGVDKPFHNTGLLRLTLDGNYIPDSCYELYEIEWYLRQAVLDNLPKGSYSTPSNIAKKRMTCFK